MRQGREMRRKRQSDFFSLLLPAAAGGERLSPFFFLSRVTRSELPRFFTQLRTAPLFPFSFLQERLFGSRFFFSLSAGSREQPSSKRLPPWVEFLPPSFADGNSPDSLFPSPFFPPPVLRPNESIAQCGGRLPDCIAFPSIVLPS